MSLHEMASETFAPMLRALQAILEKASAHATAKGTDPDALVDARLAEDMFPLAKQVQIACDHAKGAMARLSGAEAPVFEDNERTLDELKARIGRTLDYIAGVPASAFEGAAERQIIIPVPRGDIEFAMSGAQSLRDWSFPNFYFHVVTAYDILRNQGVEVGKQDFLARIGVYIRPKPPAA